ncbi:hypothetical protein ACFV7R_37265 [Streptomyces sp. NPDC059866]|uniref:hypothetical protein n=1 Tax=Streptomyces sp. NPDC059866 TaxID=3346978 RepID=UPI003665B3AC
MSASTVRRWLDQDALKPWQYCSWSFITDPDFRAKAERVLDLYARTWRGRPLGADEYVISADEKTSIQARCRCHPTLAPRAGPGDAAEPHLQPRRRRLQASDRHAAANSARARVTFGRAGRSSPDAYDPAAVSALRIAS